MDDDDYVGDSEEEQEEEEQRQQQQQQAEKPEDAPVVSADALDVISTRTSTDAQARDRIAGPAPGLADRILDPPQGGESNEAPEDAPPNEGAGQKELPRTIGTGGDSLYTEQEEESLTPTLAVTPGEEVAEEISVGPLAPKLAVASGAKAQAPGEDVADEASIETVAVDAAMDHPDFNEPAPQNLATPSPTFAIGAQETLVPEGTTPPTRAKFKIGDIVHVAARTWPGINKLGGAGKIAAVLFDSTSEGGEEVLYNVKYMLGGFEKRIEEEFIDNLESALETGARPHKERVFYHEEFARDPHKKPRYGDSLPLPQSGMIHSNNENDTSLTPTATKKRSSSEKGKMATPQFRDDEEEPAEPTLPSSDDSDYSDDSPNDGHENGMSSKLDDASFILDESINGESVTEKSTMRKERRARRRDRKTNRHNDYNVQRRHRRKRVRRIVDSDDDEQSTQEDRTESRQRKRRYIGGYQHGSNDADGSFIQPEGNPTELPDDVAQELNFKLGKTKRELRDQLNVVADRLQRKLQEFNELRTSVQDELYSVGSLDVDDLKEVNRKLLDFGEFIRREFIRSGEDVMNMIIKLLEKKGGKLPDRIDLQYENWKQEIGDHDSWVKKNLKVLEMTFNRRGLAPLFAGELPQHHKPGSPGSDASDLQSVDADESEPELDYWSDNTATVPNSHNASHVSRKNRNVRETTGISAAHKKISRKRQRQQHFQANLDDLWSSPQRISKFTQPATRFRLIRERDNRIHTDPRWDWMRYVQPQQRPRSAVQSGESFSTAVLGKQMTIPATTVKKTQPKSRSVQAALSMLREKRYRSFNFGNSSAVFHPKHNHREQNEKVKIVSNSHPAMHRQLQLARLKPPSIPPQLSSEKDSTLAMGNQTDWNEVFSVLQDEYFDAGEFAKHANLGGSSVLGTQFVDDWEELTLSDESEVAAISPERASCALGMNLRQCLSRLRVQERIAVESVLEARCGLSGPALTESLNWKLSVQCEVEYRHALASFVGEALQCFKESHSLQLPGVIEAWITEVAHVLRHIPTCSSMFGDDAGYPYLFEIAAPGIASTPLIGAICQTFADLLQLVIVMKKCTMIQPQLKSTVESLIAKHLPTSRVALSCSLFLTDLFVFVPSTHKFSSEEVEKQVPPALSLWTLLYTLIVSGAVQSGESSGLPGDFWAFLRTAYQQGFIEEVTLSYLDHTTYTGYVKDSAPSLRHECRLTRKKGKLLGADIMWDLTVKLAILFQPTTGFVHQSSSGWILVTSLLHSDYRMFLPFRTALRAHDVNSQLRAKSVKYAIRVMRRVLLLSFLWQPDSDVVDTILSKLWDVCHLSADRVESLLNFVCTIREYEPSAFGQLLGLLEEESSDVTNIMCQIVYIQVSKLEKSIYRSRYRQPILRSISTRREKHKNLAQQRLSTTNPSLADTKPAGHDKWNWTKSGKQVEASNSQNTSTDGEASQCDVSPEVDLMVSIYLVFAMVSLCGDGEAAAQLSRRKKELKREVDFFCKEIVSAATCVPCVRSQMAKSIHAIGVAAIDEGIDYSVVFVHLSDVLKSSVTDIQDFARNGTKKSTSITNDILSGSVSSCLQTIRQLSLYVLQGLHAATSSVDQGVLRAVVTAIFGSGLSNCLEAIADGFLNTSSLDMAIDVIMTWVPPLTRELSTTKHNQCLHDDEFDEFDDPEMMDLLASVDLDNPVNTTSNAVHVDQYRMWALDSLLNTGRLALQKLVINLPEKRWKTFEENFLFDVFGFLVSTCSFQFNWGTVAQGSKARILAPRLLSAILGHNPDKEWLSTCFLSEPSSDQLLCALWMMSTLDLNSLFPSEFNRSISDLQNESDSNTVTWQYSSSWIFLTDDIIARFQRPNPIMRFKMDPHIYRLLETTATKSSFGSDIQDYTNPTETGILYGVHLGVFRSFCSSVAAVWQDLRNAGYESRQEMARFRQKMMDSQRGVFVVLPEAYEVNLKSVCNELDKKKVNWFDLSSRFLRNFTPETGIESLHTVDDSIGIVDGNRIDAVIRPLIVLFKFMYDCVDAFLCHCGEMAIGQHNIFFSIMELMFRQARCAEFPVAEKRLAHGIAVDKKDNFQLHNFFHTCASKATSQFLNGVSPACIGFVESVRLFFACQKYPSLLNWFAQTLDTYQTISTGWVVSPLRVLLLNILDPHGPLGVHSYYPIIADEPTSGFDVSAVRRESFYISCGFFVCNCSIAYEHTRNPYSQRCQAQVKALRQFVLNDVAMNLVSSAKDNDEDDLETLLPIAQLLKGVLHHCNLDNQKNIRAMGSTGSNFEGNEIIVLMTHISAVIFHLVSRSNPLDNTIGCVLFMEYFRIVEELLAVNSVLQEERLSLLCSFGLSICKAVYDRLRISSLSHLETLFNDDPLLSPHQLWTTIRSYPIETNWGQPELCNVQQSQPAHVKAGEDDYGISKVKLRIDLLSSIRRVVKRCRSINCNQSMWSEHVNPHINQSSSTL